MQFGFQLTPQGRQERLRSYEYLGTAAWVTSKFSTETEMLCVVSAEFVFIWSELDYD